MRFAVGLAALGLFACSMEPAGTPVALDFGDVDVVAAGGADGASSAGGSSAGGTSATSASSLTSDSTSGGSGGTGSVEPVDYGPPLVQRMTPNAGPWGTLVTITGTDLGSANRPGTSLNLGATLTLTPGDSGIQSWTETEIALRVPFPNEGEVVVETDEGSAVAGVFTPTHEVVAEYEIPSDVDVMTSVSIVEGAISFAVSSDPIAIVSFDAGAFESEQLPDVGLRPESLRLFASLPGTLSAFALSSDSPPEIIAIEHDGTSWISSPTGVVVSEGALVAGGPDGAAVWYLAGDGYYRARPLAGVWQVDKGPLSNVVAGQKLARAAATSDGALWLARARETGTVLNDKGAPFVRHLAPDATEFGSEYQIGNDLDDTLVSLVLAGRGRGVMVDYCGSDANAVGVGPDELECRTGVLLGNESVTRSTTQENTTTRHALGFDARRTVSCDADQGTLLDSAVWAWPCLDVAALELDPAGAAVAVFRHDMRLKVLKRR